jgi:hypothetical protein
MESAQPHEDTDNPDKRNDEVSIKADKPSENLPTSVATKRITVQSLLCSDGEAALPYIQQKSTAAVEKIIPYTIDTVKKLSTREITEEVRHQIVSMHQQGHTLSSIATAVNVNYHTVSFDNCQAYKIVERFKDKGLDEAVAPSGNLSII